MSKFVVTAIAVILISFIGLFLFLNYANQREIVAEIPFGVKKTLKAQLRWMQNIPYFFYKFKSSELPVYNLYYQLPFWLLFL